MPSFCSRVLLALALIHSSFATADCSLFSMEPSLARQQMAKLGVSEIDPSKPGEFLLSELAHFKRSGHPYKLDRSLRLTPYGEPLSVGILPAGQSYQDVVLTYRSDEIVKTARTLSNGMNVEQKDVEQILRENASGTRIKERLGTNGENPLDDCYGAVFNLHTNSRWEWTTSYRSELHNFRNANIRPFKPGDTLRFGDIIEVNFLYPDSSSPQGFKQHTIHVATYLGGDFILHKYGPIPQALYEFHTITGLIRYYELMRAEKISFPGHPKRWDYRIALTFGRWDPGAI